MVVRTNNATMLYFVSDDIPEIFFENIELQYAVGQWLEILPSIIVTNFCGIRKEKHYNYKELIRGRKICKKDLEHVNKVFGILLKKIGIVNCEKCILNNFNEEKFSFDCNIVNSNEKISIRIRRKDYFEYGPELTVITDEYEKTYDYCNDKSSKNIELRLRYYTLNNNENNNKCFRYIADNSAYFKLKNGDLELSVEVYAPHDYTLNAPIDYKYILKNEKTFEQYLLNLSFPVDILTVYDAFSKICLEPNIEYPSIEIKVVKTIDTNEIVDLFSLKKGELSNFIISRNGKTISFNKNGEWVYESDKISLDSYNKLNINFNLISDSEVNNYNVFSSKEEFEDINSEVELASWEVKKVKLLVKNTINNEK